MTIGVEDAASRLKLHNTSQKHAWLAATEHLSRHHQVTEIVYEALALRHGLLKKDKPYYQYIPTAVLEKIRDWKISHLRKNNCAIEGPVVKKKRDIIMDPILLFQM